ncbi:MAG: dTMP kinase [Planctomycetota bacterium]|nr:dTMP kinase [Planctomycetota bacterium]MDA1261897.1 dTMP kinase [Planctomycetota bacterium]
MIPPLAKESPSESKDQIEIEERSRRIRVRLESATMQDASAWTSLLPGRFIVFDGPDGSGKSTQFQAIAKIAQTAGVETVEVREPGGTPIGEKIRAVLLDPANSEMVTRCEMLLYMASRAQLMEERILPALSRGAFVLADRFISSTLAYQGSAGGLARQDILSIGDIAIGGRWPDLVVVFDVDWATAKSRMARTLDRIEQKDAEYHRRVRDGYLEQARSQPEKYLVVDSTAQPEAVFAALTKGITDRLSRR